MDWRKVADEAVQRGAQQCEAELAAALAFLEPRKPQRIVEIGVHDAGAFWAWSKLLGADGRIVGVDLTDENIRHENVDEASGIANIIIGDSTSQDTIRRVRDILEAPIDFLFIDGDHSRKAVYEDYETWRPHVADNGVIGFHDTLIAAQHGWEDVLNSLTETMTIEFNYRQFHLYGIGLIVLDA